MCWSARSGISGRAAGSVRWDHYSGTGCWCPRGTSGGDNAGWHSLLSTKTAFARYGERMVSLSTRMLDGWTPGRQMDIHEEMMRLTLSIVAEALFSTDITQNAGDVSEGLDSTLHHFQWWSRTGFLVPLWVPVTPNVMFQRAKRRLDAIVNQIIAERRQSGQRCDDLLDMLLAARDEDGSAMSPKQVRDEVMTLLLAGHETTANALTWTFYALGPHPDIEARLVEEVSTVLNGKLPTVADLPNLKVHGNGCEGVDAALPTRMGPGL